MSALRWISRAAVVATTVISVWRLWKVWRGKRELPAEATASS